MTKTILAATLAGVVYLTGVPAILDHAQSSDRVEITASPVAAYLYERERASRTAERQALVNEAISDRRAEKERKLAAEREAKRKAAAKKAAKKKQINRSVKRVSIPVPASVTMACIRKHESGNNYRRVSASGKFRGAYMFHSGYAPTWAKRAGYGEWSSVLPDRWPPAVQDAVAYDMGHANGWAAWDNHTSYYCPGF